MQEFCQLFLHQNLKVAKCQAPCELSALSTPPTSPDNNSPSTLHLPPSTKFAMFPDCDEPGERLFLQLKEVLPNLVHHQLPPGCKDYSDYYLSTRPAKIDDS